MTGGAFGPDFGPDFAGGHAANPMREARDTLTRALADHLPAGVTFHADWPPTVIPPCVVLQPADSGWLWRATTDGGWRIAVLIRVIVSRDAGGEPALAACEDTVWAVLQALAAAGAAPSDVVELRALDGDQDTLSADIPVTLLYTPEEA